MTSWRAVRFDWNRVRAFLVTAEEGSYSAAARALGLTQPTVGRQVAALEEELGVVLFERVGNTLEPTDSGTALIEHARSMGEAASRLSLTAEGRGEDVSGVVRVTASQLISAYLLGPAVARIRREHPGLTLEIVASNAVRDLRRREADLAVRNTAPTDETLVGRRLPDAVARPYATRAYLDSLGDAADPLSRADFFGFDDTERMVQGLQALGLPVSADSFRVVCDDHLVQWALARQGLGICLVMEAVGEADPTMVSAAPELPGIPIPMWLVAHREVRTSQRVRVVFDALVAELTADG